MSQDKAALSAAGASTSSGNVKSSRKGRSSKPSSSKKKDSPYTYKLFRVKNRDGMSTTVSVDPVLATTAAAVFGDTKRVGQIAREASLMYDREEAKCSRSRFVSRALTEAVTAARV